MLGEIQRGVEITRSRDPAKAAEIEIWAGKLETSFAVVPAGAAIFRRHAQLMRGRPDALYEDALIAATALVHDFVVVTRNTIDFEGFGAKMFDPVGFAGA
jgi:predicted nucleic acid-binding protein